MEVKSRLVEALPNKNYRLFTLQTTYQFPLGHWNFRPRLVIYKMTRKGYNRNHSKNSKNLLEAKSVWFRCWMRLLLGEDGRARHEGQDDQLKEKKNLKIKLRTWH